jgi:aminoglycoside 6'-N-acetyltransferase
LQRAEFEGDVRLREATPEDRFRIHRWFSDPALSARWGSTASAQAEISIALGSATALSRIIMCDRADIGYAHAIEISVPGGTVPDNLLPGTWDVLAIVTRQEHTAREEAAALALITSEVFATTLALACCGLVSVRNEIAARAYESAGYRWARIWHDPSRGPVWLMLKERPA